MFCLLTQYQTFYLSVPPLNIHPKHGAYVKRTRADGNSPEESRLLAQPLSPSTDHFDSDVVRPEDAAPDELIRSGSPVATAAYRPAYKGNLHIKEDRIKEEWYPSFPYKRGSFISGVPS